MYSSFLFSLFSLLSLSHIKYFFSLFSLLTTPINGGLVVVIPKNSNDGGVLWWLGFHEKQTVGFDGSGGVGWFFIPSFSIDFWWWWAWVVGVFRFDCWDVCGNCGLTLLGWFSIDLCLICLGLMLGLVRLIWDWWRDGAMRWRKTLGLVDLGFEKKRKVN